jgi:hypothetical protein
LAGDPNNPARFKDDASADELREEVMHAAGKTVHAMALIDAQTE